MVEGHVLEIPRACAWRGRNAEMLMSIEGDGNMDTARMVQRKSVIEGNAGKQIREEMSTQRFANLGRFYMEG